MKPNSKKAAGLERVLRALHHRNYRLFFVGQGISLIGTWVQRIAQIWLVYRLTHSTILLGVVGFTSQIPIFILSPFAGVLADRLNRRRILVATQTLAMIQAFILALLVLTDLVTVWHIVTLSIFLGIVDAFDMPTRQAFLLEMVEDKEDLGNAVALNSSLVTSARLIGPSIAGIVIAALGEGMCFFLNGLSFLAVILSLLAMRVIVKKIEIVRSHILEELKEGASYSFGFAPIRSVLLLVALASLVGMPYQILMPVFAKDILQGGPRTLGFLMGGAGVGALIGVMYLASRKRAAGLGKWISPASGIFGIGLITFSLSRFFWFSLPLTLLTGFGMMVQFASSNTVLQTVVEEDKRGRVLSFYAMASKGMAPFGSLLAGALASRIGAPNTLIIGGISCILGASLLAKKISLLK